MVGRAGVSIVSSYSKTDIIRKFPIELYKSELDKFNKKERTKMLNLLQEAFYNGYNGDNENENEDLWPKYNKSTNKNEYLPYL